MTNTKPSNFIALKDILEAEQRLIDENLTIERLERLIANYETYGDFHPIKPVLSEEAVIPFDLLKRSA